MFASHVREPGQLAHRLSEIDIAPCGLALHIKTYVCKPTRTLGHIFTNCKASIYELKGPFSPDPSRCQKLDYRSDERAAFRMKLRGVLQYL